MPRGEQRIKDVEDQMQMRNYFKENDLLSGEIQQININGNINLQTRNLKYGKLKNGILLKVNHMLVKKTKHQFIDLVDNIKAILGLNGIIWVYFSTVVVEDEYFNDDKTKIDSLNKDEKPDYNSSILIVLFRNIIKSLDEYGIIIIRENILKYYELFMNLFHKGISKKEYKKIAIISKDQEEVIIGMLKEEINKEKIKKQKIREEKEKEKNKDKEKNKQDKFNKNDGFEIEDKELEIEN